ncbi:uncharacterized protein PG986_006218 [Apiospora aurea]|uniref:Uncharacterized protein n=1 Tax=Apiospora aurea TaxID=335848 RepID=A0ABR1QL92_9PEZI
MGQRWTYEEIVHMLAWLDRCVDTTRDYKENVDVFMSTVSAYMKSVFADKEARAPPAIETKLIKYKAKKGMSPNPPHRDVLFAQGSRCMLNLQPASEYYDENLAKDIKQVMDGLNAGNSAAPRRPCSQRPRQSIEPSRGGPASGITPTGMIYESIFFKTKRSFENRIFTTVHRRRADKLQAERRWEASPSYSNNPYVRIILGLYLELHIHGSGSSSSRQMRTTPVFDMRTSPSDARSRF